jgi:hypothetical protein
MKEFGWTCLSAMTFACENFKSRNPILLDEVPKRMRFQTRQTKKNGLLFLIKRHICGKHKNIGKFSIRLVA